MRCVRLLVLVSVLVASTTGVAVATGHAVEQERPSHVNYTYPTRVTVSHRAYCANLHRTVYKKVVAQILGPSPGVFGGRTVGVVWTCYGISHLAE